MNDSYDPASHYDRVTAAWRLLLGEELHYGVFPNGDEPLPLATAELTRKMIDAAQLVPDLDVLDVGCGSGGPACQLVADFGLRVLGITTSPVGVAEATERAAQLDLRDARFELRDGTDNGQPDESFDRVWVLESSHLMREREKLIAECARVLRPGGRVALCDIMRRREIPFLEVRERRADFITLRTAMGDARMETMPFYADAFGAAGLEVDATLDLTESTVPTFDRWRANASTHEPQVRAALGDEGFDAFVRTCDILEGFWRDATFGYGLVAGWKG